MNLKLNLTLYIKFNSKRIMDLNVKHQTMKFIGENHWEQDWQNNSYA